MAEPGSLGRVVATQRGTLSRIVEAADATAREQRIDLVNAGFYALRAPDIFSYLHELTPANVQGELYLTDAVSAAAARGEELRLVEVEDPSEALGVNTRRDLAMVHGRLTQRLVDALMARGVTVLNPATTVVEMAVEVAADTIVHPDVSLLGSTKVGPSCVLHRGVWLRDATLGDGVEVGPYSVVEGARVGSSCRVGPFARLLPGANLEPGAEVESFVEVRGSQASGRRS
jgi:bifunctional UDP-N-acetylglucosamine pyrophosphorylase/glucosamine-1-phosphate N-acetyltransferase